MLLERFLAYILQLKWQGSRVFYLQAYLDFHVCRKGEKSGIRTDHHIILFSIWLLWNSLFLFQSIKLFCFQKYTLMARFFAYIRRQGFPSSHLSSLFRVVKKSGKARFELTTTKHANIYLWSSKLLNISGLGYPSLSHILERKMWQNL